MTGERSKVEPQSATRFRRIITSGSHLGKRCRGLSRLFIAALMATLCSACVAGAESATSATSATSRAANYARPFEPPTRPALLALPPGAVQPEGWLRDWALAAKDGYTGHTHEYHEAFRQAWAADYTMRGENLAWPRGGWPYEGGGYWFDGLARLAYALHDEALIRLAQTRLGVVCEHMNPNSILFLWWLDKNKPEDVEGAKIDGAWPIWASGLLGRALSGYYAASGDSSALRTLETAYSGGSWMRMGWGMSNIWPAYDTYTWTGNRAIAGELTALFAPDGGGLPPGGDSWSQYRRPPNPQPGTEDNDHVVHFLESTTPWALGYLWTGKREFLDAALGWHSLFERVAMQPHGVPVADECWGPTGAFHGTETCDVAAYIWSKAMLFLVTGDGAMGDRMERAFFNAGPATVTRDYKNHVYFQSPNRVVKSSPPVAGRPESVNYQLCHSPLCCTAALNRILPWYVTHMWMATYDNGLLAACYGPCRTRALVGDRVPVEIVCNTDYPFNETIEMTVTPAKETAFPISFRIPGWCQNPELRVNSTAMPIAKDEHGLVRIDRTWKAGDTVSLRFPMLPVLATGVDQSRDVPDTPGGYTAKVFPPEANPTPGRPYATVSCGPLLFALAIPDTVDANTPDPAARWQFALDTKHPELTMERASMPSKWDWPLAAPVSVSARAVPIDWQPLPENPRLPDAAVAARGPSERLRLIPYGCTKFRISMFPIAAEAK